MNVKNLRRKIIYLLAIVTIFSSSTIAYASPSVVYYGGTISNTSIQTFGPFSITNSNNVLTIAGWQESTASNPRLIYKVIKNNFFNTELGTKIYDGNIPQSGTWYNYTFTGIPTNTNLKMRIEGGGIGTINYAGNAYDGY